MSKARSLSNLFSSATDMATDSEVAAAVALVLPSQSGNSGKYLTTSGTSASWGTVSQYSLPSQTGNSGKFLTTNGTAESWATVTVPPVFTPRSAPFTGVIRQINAIASNGSNIYVAVAEGGYLKSSTDGGVTWTARNANLGAVNINSVAYGNGIFVAVSNTNGITTSTDGITWTQRTSNVSGNLYSVRYLNGNFIAVGTGANGGAGGITTSTDGITWTKRTTPGTGNSTDLRDVTYGNGYYYAVGMFNTTGNGYYSANLTTWVGTNIPAGSNLYMAYYINNTFVTFGPDSLYVGTNLPTGSVTNASLHIPRPAPSCAGNTALYNGVLYVIYNTFNSASSPIISRITPAIDGPINKITGYYQSYNLPDWFTSSAGPGTGYTSLYVSPTDEKIVIGDIDGRIWTSF